jgi:hypothetical protein
MEAYLKYFDFLELTPEATITEIRNSYTHLKSLYSGNSIEIIALNQDFPDELREDYLSRLDEAYEKLSARIENKVQATKPQAVTIDEELRSWIESMGCFSGAALKGVRERIGVDLKDIFAATRIQPRHLKDIEDEAFESFRAEVYLRGFLIEYTHFLGLNTQKVLNDYLPRYRAWAANGQVRILGDAVEWLTKMA